MTNREISEAFVRLVAEAELAAELRTALRNAEALRLAQAAELRAELAEVRRELAEFATNEAAARRAAAVADEAPPAAAGDNPPEDAEFELDREDDPETYDEAYGRELARLEDAVFDAREEAARLAEKLAAYEAAVEATEEAEAELRSAPSGNRVAETDLDGVIAAFRVRTGGLGFSVTVSSLGTGRRPMVLLTWNRLGYLDRKHILRTVFRPTLAEALAHAFEFERRVDLEGDEAAFAWHKRQRTLSEAEAAHWADDASEAKVRLEAEAAPSGSRSGSAGNPKNPKEERTP